MRMYFFQKGDTTCVGGMTVNRQRVLFYHIYERGTLKITRSKGLGR